LRNRGGAAGGLVAELVAAAARHPDIGELVRAGYEQRHALALARLQRACEREGHTDTLPMFRAMDAALAREVANQG
jgi:hypothetical protein